MSFSQPSAIPFPVWTSKSENQKIFIANRTLLIITLGPEISRYYGTPNTELEMDVPDGEDVTAIEYSMDGKIMMWKRFSLILSPPLGRVIGDEPVVIKIYKTNALLLLEEADPEFWKKYRIFL